MIKLFVTGDNHLCRQYANSPIRNLLIQSRLDSMKAMIRMAEKEECGLFIITGDLFDRVSNVSKKEIDQIVGILEEFDQTVLVLPGNHDFYTGGEKLWKDFLARTTESSNIVLLNQYQRYTFASGEDELIIYPAYCDSKHSKKNKLGWISEKFKMNEAFSIGLAHGAIRGITPDLKEEYFPMDITELNAIPVDAWLIGHTHITYPFNLPYDKDMSGYTVFNAGTHEQLDSGNKTEGNAFIITLAREAGIKKVYVRKIHTGTLIYKDIKHVFGYSDPHGLEQVLKENTMSLSDRSIIDMEISGTITEEEYDIRKDIYEAILGRFLYYTVNDDALVPAITLEKIRDEYSEFGLAAQFLEALMPDPVEVQMGYELLKRCNGNDK